MNMTFYSEYAIASMNSGIRVRFSTSAAENKISGFATDCENAKLVNAGERWVVPTNRNQEAQNATKV